MTQDSGLIKTEIKYVKNVQTIVSSVMISSNANNALLVMKSKNSKSEDKLLMHVLKSVVMVSDMKPNAMMVTQ